MKRCRLIPALPIALLTAPLIGAICLYPPFARAWASIAALPALRLLNAATMRLPFCLLEWGLITYCGLNLAAAARLCIRRRPRRALRLLGRRLARLSLLIVFAFAALWLPLYRAVETPEPAASGAQLVASCEALIDALNEARPDFSVLPEDLPAKRISFPFWMRALGITGLFSFPTSEALISPELPNSAAPFVAVHEAMHAQGIAGEGLANIAAWEECMSRGGLYADSARLWALKYSMEAVCGVDPRACAQLQQRMHAHTFAAWREVGGGHRRGVDRRGAQAALSALGAGAAAGDYEILAVYLASRTAV